MNMREYIESNVVYPWFKSFDDYEITVCEHRDEFVFHNTQLIEYIVVVNVQKWRAFAGTVYLSRNIRTNEWDYDNEPWEEM